MQYTITIKNGVARYPAYRFKQPINVQIANGEQIAIVGSNGSGKSLLVDTMIGRYPLLMNEVVYDFSLSLAKRVSECVKYITFRDSYGDADSNYYYQQRWNSQDLEDTPMVRDLLPECKNEILKNTMYRLFGMEDILSKHIILLSSGELRKFQLIRTLLTNPRILIIDNPFIGLDARTRDLLHDLLGQLIQKTDLQVILILSKADDIPQFITHVIPIENRICAQKITLEEYLSNPPQKMLHVLDEKKRRSIIALPYADNLYHSEHIVDMNKICIRYGARTILKNLSWTVIRGEKWALSGDNGSGKSTLLSLVCADNPQSYACNISLFGRKRGSGESIWEIKKHIGYVSPEMHRAYLKNLPAIDIVSSGLHDSIGLYRETRDFERNVCLWWMDIFGIADLANRNFLQLSSGEQRMILLARAFVKDPELLILDEPLHGLDSLNCRLVKDIIETFCQRKDKTLIMVTHYPEELPNCITNYLRLSRNE